MVTLPAKVNLEFLISEINKLLKTFKVTVLAPSLDDILSTNRSVTDFPFHWQNVRPVLESAVEFFKLDELFNLEIELVPDGGCKTVNIIEPGTKRFYQSLKTKTLSEEDCSEKFTYSRRSNIFIGLTCDYPYAQLLQQGRYWETSLTDEIPGSGFPMIGISLRGKSFRSGLGNLSL